MPGNPAGNAVISAALKISRSSYIELYFLFNFFISFVNSLVSSKTVSRLAIEFFPIDIIAMFQSFSP